ncbi:MAG: hypothetical protein GF393_09045 [Armatimonadia bacterium]|nr:hypothetical protein [Armatimonadia bacterium]
MWVRIEDAARSDVSGSRAMVRPGETTLVASIGGCFDAGAPRAIRHRYYRFEAREPIELELPFAIEIEPSADESEPGRFSIQLGDMSASGAQKWNDLDSLWEPLFGRIEEVRVGSVMVHGRQGTRYGQVSLDGLDAKRERSIDCPTWRLCEHDGDVICEAVATGPISDG